MQQTKMNMEEKKKLEKIAIADIEKAIVGINLKRNEEVSKVSESLIKNPSAEVKNLFELYKKTYLASQKAEKELDKLGYDIGWKNGRDSEMVLNLNSYNSTHKDIENTRKSFDDRVKKAEGLKRDIVVGLYTTGVEAQAFLTNLAKKLEALLG